MKRVESKIVVGEAPTGTRNLANLTDSGSHSRIPSVDRSDGMFEGVLDRGQALKGRETKQAALQCIVAPLLQAWWLRISRSMARRGSSIPTCWWPRSPSSCMAYVVSKAMFTARGG